MGKVKPYLALVEGDAPAVYFSVENENTSQFLNNHDSLILHPVNKKEGFYLSKVIELSAKVYVKISDKGPTQGGSHYWKIIATDPDFKEREVSFKDEFNLSSTYKGRDYSLSSELKESFLLAISSEGEEKKRTFQMFPHPDLNFNKDLKQLGVQLDKIFRSHQPAVAISGMGGPPSGGHGSGVSAPPIPST
jgi:hypothetical protein